MKSRSPENFMNMREVKVSDVDLANVHVDALWEVHDMKCRSPETFMNMREVKMPDEKGFLSRSMTIKA